MSILTLLGLGVISYLLGSIPFGFILTRLFRGVDVRRGGSQHTGALNTWRMAGLLPAALTVVGDMGKAILAVKLAEMVDPSGWGVAVAGIMVIVGHIWPLYVGFRGGVGMACGLALLLYLVPPAFFATLIAWLVWLAIFRHFPRSQGAVAVTVPFILWALNSPPQILVFGFLAGAIIFLRHIPEFRRTTLTLGMR